MLAHTGWLGRLRAAALIATIVIAPASSSYAETWPQRPIRIIVPFAAGGAVDIVARQLQEPMGKNLGTTMVVENRAGGAGVPASEALVRAAPDGYTVGFFASSYVSNAVTQSTLSFNVVNDITPISMAVINTVMILVPANSPIRTLKDLVDQAKARPGALSYATPGVNTAMHFAGELLKTRAGIDMVHIPYRGAGPALNDLLGGQVPVTIMGIGPSLPFIRSGQLRAIAITTEKRSKLLPDIPTVAEQGYPGYRFAEWFAMIAPKDLPPELKKRLHTALLAAIHSDDLTTRLENIGLEPTSSSPDELRDFLATELARIREIATQTKMLESKN